MQLLRLTMPTADLVSVSELKEHLRIEHDQDDRLLKNLTRAAYDWIENYIGRSLLTTHWEYTSSPVIKGYEMQQALPFPALQSIEEAYHVHTHNRKEKLKRFSIEVRHGVPYFCFVSMGLPIIIRYSAGYGSLTADIPEGICLAAKTLIASWYENREGMGWMIPPMVESLLQPFQIRRLI